MENDDPHKSQGKPPGESSPIASNTERVDQKGKTNGAHEKPTKKKKWSLWRHWKSASRAKQLKWFVKGAGVMIAGSILVVYILGLLQNKIQFKIEHRPRVIFIRPPVLFGTVNCEVTEKAIYLHTGAMRIWVKNIRKEDAIGAFVAGPQFDLVPNKKIGIPFFDDLPRVTDEMCKLRVEPKMKEFPVNGEQEVGINMVQGAATFSLLSANKSVSVSMGGPEKEPETPVDQKVTRAPVAKDAVFQLYAPVCVYYFGEDGERYGTCSEYRFTVNGRVENSDHYSFSCTDTPLSGTFEQTFFGYCQN